MPSKRAIRDRLLEVALEALANGLTQSRVPWAVIGGIAVIARGVRRFTTDIDVAVRGDAISVELLLQNLAAFSIVPRIDDAVSFAEANLVLLLRHEESGVDLGARRSPRAAGSVRAVARASLVWLPSRLRLVRLAPRSGIVLGNA